MPYVKRNENNEIVKIHQLKVEGCEQWVEDSDPELLGFIKGLKVEDQVKQALSSSDNDMGRVVEDLIDLLMKKQIFVYTELPEAVQAKLNTRSQLRKDMNALESPINNDESIL